MISHTAEHILAGSGLTITQPRLLILNLFLNNSHAISNVDIEKKLGHQINRVSVYRIVQSFIEANIIHSIVHNGTQMLYALSTSFNADVTDTHGHFTCTLCELTFCVHDIETSIPKSIKGNKILKKEILYYGTCKKCLIGMNEN